MVRVHLARLEAGLIQTLEKEFVLVSSIGLDWAPGLCDELGIVVHGETLLRIADIAAWHRAGAETYTATASVTTTRRTFGIIAKALVSFATPPNQQLRDWLARRQVLQGAGVLVPHLYGTRPGMLVEQFIEGRQPLLQEDVEQLSSLAGILDALGFHSVAFLRNIIVSAGQIYYVDFGNDLGNPSPETSQSAFHALRDELTGSPLVPRMMARYQMSFQGARNRGDSSHSSRHQ